VIERDILIFQLSSHQKRVQRITGVVLLVVAIGLLAGGLAARTYPVGYVLIAVAALVFFGSWLALANIRAMTECNPTGLRARTIYGRLRETPWSRVAGISVQDLPRGGSRAVTVTTTKGHQFRLAAPSDTGRARDEFNATAQQIVEYWQARRSEAGAAGGVPRAAAHPRTPGRRLLRGILVTVASAAAILVLAGTTFETVQAYAIRFGLGESGSFSSASQDCSHTGNCMWTGTFTGANGGKQYGVTFADGGHQGTASAVDVPATYLWGSAYPVGGGGDWVTYSVFEFLELVALYFGVHFWRRRRGQRRKPVPSAGGSDSQPLVARPPSQDLIRPQDGTARPPN
jgi:hypothetical protein